MNQIEIGLFLKKLRNEKKLTQDQMAEQLNVSGRTISRWETGSNMPDIEMLVELSEFFNISISEIIDGERKSDKMNQEEKEKVLKIVDYSENKNNVLMKRMLIISSIGLVTLLLGLILLEFKEINPIIKCLDGICFGIAIGALIACILFATGVLSKINSDINLRRVAGILKIVCIIIVVFAIVTCTIFTILSL